MDLIVKSSVSRVVGVGALLLLLVFFTYTAARNGYAARLTAKAEKNNDLAAATAAIELNPRDADAHLLRGGLLEVNGNADGALAEYRTAVEVRPQDYVLWLQLARALELRGQKADAISAARKATELAPAYVLPHWQLGNILVRSGQREEGFSELRFAANSDKTLLPSIIDLAWQLSRGDSEYVTRAIQPDTPAARVAVGNYFKQHGAHRAALAIFGAAGNDSEVTSARQQYAGDLIAAGKFKDAFVLWQMDHKSEGSITNPNFSAESDLDQPGFDWRRLNPAPAISLTLDAAVPKNSPSLRVDFNGPSEPGPPVIAQIVLIEPHTRYQLSFASSSERLTSGGLPRLTIVDAASHHVLGQSKALAAESWTTSEIEFTTEPGSEAIQIALDRASCSNTPCPIFGRLWLDEFQLRKIN